MNFFKDTGLLIVFCFFTLFHDSPDIVYVFGFLTALIFCCADYFLELNKLLLPIFLLYLLVSILLPELLYFYPACAYVLLHHKRPPQASACISGHMASGKQTWSFYVLESSG